METLTPEDFSAWSRKLRKSSRKTYTELYRATHDSLFRYACFITSDRESAYDVLQDVYIKLWEIRKRIDPSRSLKALLYRMVRNRALNYVQRGARIWEVTLENGYDGRSSDPLPDTAYEAQQLDENLRRWIMELPKRRREALLLSRYAGLSHAEAAEVMNLAPKTVNNHIVLALAHLRKRLRAHMEEKVAS